MKLFKLGLAILLATTFFSCSTNTKEQAWREGYIAGAGLDIDKYVYMAEGSTFFHSIAKDKITLQTWKFENTTYRAISMQQGKYTDDIDYIQLTLQPNAIAEFTPDKTIFGNDTVITSDTDIFTINYPVDVEVEKDVFLGSLKLSADGVSDYFDVYNTDDVYALFK